MQHLWQRLSPVRFRRAAVSAISDRDAASISMSTLADGVDGGERRVVVCRGGQDIWMRGGGDDIWRA